VTYLRKFLREFFRTSLSYSLKIKPWPNTCKSIKDSSKIFNLYHSSLKERKTFVLLKIIVTKRLCVSWIVSFLNIRGEGSLDDSEVVKEFYKDTRNLKWVSWGLDVGTGSGRTSINRVCKFSLPLSHLYYCNQFLSCTLKENWLNWLLLLFLHIKYVIYHLKRGLKFVSGKILKLNSPSS